MKIRGNTVGTSLKPEKAIVKATNLTDEQKAQVRENIGAVSQAEIGDKPELLMLGTNILTKDTSAYLDSNEQWIEQEGCSIYVGPTTDNEGYLDGKTIIIRTYMYGAMTLMARNFEGAYGITWDFFTNSEADIQQNPESGIFEFQYTFTPPEGIEHDMTHFHISFCENPYMDKPEVFIKPRTIREDINSLQSEMGDINDALDSIIAIQNQLIGGDGV